MNEFEQMLNSVEDVKVRDVVKGEILTVDDDQATVSIVGTGVEGILTLREITDDRDADIHEFVKPGDVLDLLVVKQIVGKESEGANVYLLSLKRLAARKAWTELEGSEGQIVTVKVSRSVKGGLSVDYKGARGFIPASMIDTRFVRDTKRFEGQEIQAKIIEVNASENRFILNRREVIEAENADAFKEAVAALNVGDIVEGKVARLTDFGVFVDLGGVDGLVHVTELSHQRGAKPADIVKVGDVINVKVLKVDADAGRISLSLKAAQPGPWDDVEEKVQRNSVFTGTIKRLTDFGAFVELYPGVEGLVHVSQISWDRVEKPSDRLKVGEEIDVKVLDVKPEEQRISLSIKALEETPEHAKRDNSGDRPTRKPQSRRAEPRQDFSMPESQDGFSLADQLGADFNLDDFTK